MKSAMRTWWERLQAEWARMLDDEGKPEHPGIKVADAELDAAIARLDRLNAEFKRIVERNQ